jgi:hypothetical protein
MTVWYFKCMTFFYEISTQYAKKTNKQYEHCYACIHHGPVWIHEF